MPELLRVASPRIAHFVDGEGVAEVRRRLAATTRTQAERAAATSPELASVWDELRGNLSEGKLVRPAILLAVADAATGADAAGSTDTPDPHQRETVLELAVTVELLHHAFLLHDDVIDHDTLRRGRPNLIARLGDDFTPDGATPAERQAVGEAAAILAGDLVLSQAHHRLARLDVPQPVRLRLLDVLEETLAHSVAGELADVGFSRSAQRPTLAQVLAMSESKTGAYTVRLPLLWALIATGTEIPDSLEPYAQAVGLAFQLQDDLLGLFGDPALVGKDPVSDLREGKFTAVMAHASRTPAWDLIEPRLGDPDLTPDDGARLIALLADCGARAAVENDLAEALADAHRRAREAGPLADVLDAVVIALTERRS